MPRLTDSTPKYRKHKASGQALVTLSGRDHYLGPHGTKASKVEYDRLIAEWLAGGRSLAASRNGSGQDETLTVAELFVRYWRFARGYYAGRSLCAIKQAMRHARELYGRTPAGQFGPLALKAVREKMVGAGWSRKYVNEQVNRLRRVFKWGVENELISATVLHALQAVPGLKFGRTEARESDPVKPVPAAFVDAALPHMPAQVAAMVRLQALTGMRPGEVTIMRAADVDTSGAVWLYRPTQHKTRHHGHERLVYIGPQAQAVLKTWLRTELEAFLFQPREAVAAVRAARSAARTTPLSCGNRPGSNRRRKPRRKAGDVYDVAAYRRAITRACAKAGVPEWHPNQLRHSHATEVRRQHGVEAARILLGHRSTAMTEVYAERDASLAVAVAAKLG